MNDTIEIKKCDKWVGDKYADGMTADGNTLILQLPMKLDIQETEKNNVKKTYEQLAQQGSRFGGVEIGQEPDGTRIMANISIYRKPKAITQVGRNTPLAIG